MSSDRAWVAVMSVLAGVVGCTTFAADTWHGPKSDHFDGQRFYNPVPETERGIGDLLKWVLHRHPGHWRELLNAPPGKPPPHRVDGGRMRVTFINHSTVLIQTEGLNILTDPIWSDRASPVSWAGPLRKRPPGIRFDDLPPIDAVLLSHSHYDHFDLPTLARLAARDHPKLLTGLGNKAILDQAGISGGVELDWWSEVELGPGVKAISVPVQHFANRGATDRDGTLWTGFAIEGPSGGVYFGGDTGFGPHFDAARERLGPFRLALLPIGAFRPEWFMSPVHMSPAQAVEAHRALGAGISVAIHFGTFAQADDGQFEPLAALRAALDQAGNPKPRFWALELGEGREVPPLVR